MFPGQSSKKPARSEKHPVFDEICNSCSKELRSKGFDAEVYLLQGGVGLKILNEDFPSIAKIAHLPISEMPIYETGALTAIFIHYDMEPGSYLMDPRKLHYITMEAKKPEMLPEPPYSS